MAEREQKEDVTLTEEEAEEVFNRFRRVAADLLRVPKAELEQRLAERRSRSRRRIKDMS